MPPVKRVTTVWPLTLRWQLMSSRSLEWSSNQSSMSILVSSARFQLQTSACQVSLGCAASNRMKQDFGRFLGWGTISPASSRILRMVEVEGGVWPSCS